MSNFSKVADLENQLDLLSLSIHDLSSKNSELEAENASLKARLARYETISIENRVVEDPSIGEDTGMSVSNLIDHVASSIVTTQEFESDDYIDAQMARIINVSGLSNPLCLAFLTLRESVITTRFGGIVSCGKEKEMDFVLCGGADKQLHLYSCTNTMGKKVFTMSFGAPILSVDCHESQVCCGMMDGSTAYFDFSNLPSFQAANDICCMHYTNYIDSFVFSQTVHSKYVVRTRFSPDGNYYVTVSYDKRVIIYHKKVSHSDNTEMWEISLSVNFDNTPEDAVFIQSNDRTLMELVVAVRESVCLYSFYADDNGHWKQRFVSLNSNEWDLYASFSVLHLCVQQSSSNDNNNDNDKVTSQTVLCCCADNQNHYLYEWKYPPLLIEKLENKGSLEDTNHEISIMTDQASLASSSMTLEGSKLLNILVGHNCSQYGKPVVSWSFCGRYLYSNSEHEMDIVVYDTCKKSTSNFVVSRLSGHQNIVRYIAHHPSKHLLASISYDKNLVMWTCSTLLEGEKGCVQGMVPLTKGEEEIQAALHRDMSSSLQVKESWLCQCGKASVDSDNNNISFNGLFATRSFAEGEVVCIYYGHEYRTKEALKIEDKSYLMRLGEQCYVDTRLPTPSDKIPIRKQVTKEIEIEIIIEGGGEGEARKEAKEDATEATEATEETYCIARYINDCINPAGYNVQFEKRPFTKPFPCAIVRAIRPILEGEEIFVSYGKRYWEGCDIKASRIAFMELHQRKEALTHQHCP